MTDQQVAQDYVKVSTAARELGTSVQWVHALIKRGSLVAVSVDGAWLVRRSSVERLASERHGRATQPKTEAD